MPVSTLAEAKKIEFHGLTARPIAVPSRGTAELAIWHLEVAPGLRGDEHTVDREEVFVVRKGRLAATLGGERCEGGAGDALTVPPGVPFPLGNGRGNPAAVVGSTPAGAPPTLGGPTNLAPWS